MLRITLTLGAFSVALWAAAADELPQRTPNALAADAASTNSSEDDAGSTGHELKLPAQPKRSNQQGDGDPSRDQHRIRAVPHQWVLGIMLDRIPPVLRTHLPNLLRGDRGLLITRVTPGSAAENAGLNQTDIILTFNREPLNSPNQLQKLLASCGARPVQLSVVQNGRLQQVTVVPALQVRTSDQMPSAFAFSMTTPNGSVSLTAVNGHFKLVAKYRDRLDQPQELNIVGTAAHIDTQLDVLPADLCDMIRRKLGRRAKTTSFLLP